MEGGEMKKSGKPKVQINYKSGLSMIMECDNFKISRVSSGISFEWENGIPNPMLIGVDDIESVWEL
jgi:hypothetical protein